MPTKTLLASVLASALLLSACGDDVAAPAASSAPEAKEYVNEFAGNLPANAESIIVATQANSPPFEFKDGRGNIIGFDVDIITAIAADQGIKATVFETKWDGIFEGLTQKSYDLVIGALGDSPERRSKYAISDPYVYSPAEVIVPSDSPLKSLNDLTGKKIAYVAGDFMESQINGKNIQYKAVPVESVYLTLTSLVRNEADAAITDRLVAAYTMKSLKEQDPNISFRTFTFQAEDEGSTVFAAAKGNEALITKLNTGLANIKKNGIYDRVYAKWFGEMNTEKQAASAAK